MKQIEFAKKCQPLNKEYFKLFNYVPTPTDYVATREEFVEALEKCVSEKVEISTVLKFVEKNVNDEDKY